MKARTYVFLCDVVHSDRFVALWPSAVSVDRGRMRPSQGQLNGNPNSAPTRMHLMNWGSRGGIS